MSSISKCPTCGLFFDQNQYSACPNCNPGIAPQQPACQAPAAPLPFSAPVSNIGRTVAVAPMSDQGRTVAIIRDKLGINPVVAWLVCIDGKEKGRDYKVFDGNNKIGRDSGMDICITGDDTISRENEAIVVYAAAVKKYFLVAGGGENVIYVNDSPLPASQTCELAAYDKIKLGRTMLMFIPMCGERFQWE